MSLYAERQEHERFVWPSPADGKVAISAAQLAYMLDGIDRRPVVGFENSLAGVPARGRVGSDLDVRISPPVGFTAAVSRLRPRTPGPFLS